MSKSRGVTSRTLVVQGTSVTVTGVAEHEYLSLTDMLRAKEGDFFIADWLRNRNTVEFLGVWERVHNPEFNYGEFATIRSKAGLNSYRLSVKEWVEKTGAINAIAIVQVRSLLSSTSVKRLTAGRKR